MSGDPEVHKSNRRDPERWRALVSGEECPICASGRPYGIVAELEARATSPLRRASHFAVTALWF